MNVLDLPKVIVTTIVRTANLNETHGYIYLVDFNSESIEKISNWDDPDISFEGRGGERGLRGVSIYKDKIYVGSGTKLLEFDKQFNLLNSYSNPYLSDIHEMHRENQNLYIVSSGYDAVLCFNLDNKSFTKGYALERKKDSIQKGLLYKACNKYYYPVFLPFGSAKNFALQIFDPTTDKGPSHTNNRKGKQLHINTVFKEKDNLYMSGTMSNYMFRINNDKLYLHSALPLGTHNPIPYKNNVVFNHTANQQIIYQTPKGKLLLKHKAARYAVKELTNMPQSSKHAKPGWARGLIFIENLMVTGTSPATVMLFDLNTKTQVKSIQISNDVRDTVHGLAFYEF